MLLRRVFTVMTVMVIMVAMLLAMAMPAMAGNFKAGKGEQPLFNDNKQNYVLHCGPFLEAVGQEGYRGAVTTNSDVNAADCFIPSNGK